MLLTIITDQVITKKTLYPKLSCRKKLILLSLDGHRLERLPLLIRPDLPLLFRQTYCHKNWQLSRIYFHGQLAASCNFHSQQLAYINCGWLRHYTLIRLGVYFHAFDSAQLTVLYNGAQ